MEKPKLILPRQVDGPFRKGHPKYGGRKKGTQNKITMEVRLAVQKAFDELGGAEGLVRWAKSGNKTDFYRIASKLIPAQMTGLNGGPLQFEKVEREQLRNKIMESFLSTAEEGSGSSATKGNGHIPKHLN